MILIADSGSTKTDWCLIQGKETVLSFTTQGINPFHQSSEEIINILKKEAFSLLTEQETKQDINKIRSNSTKENPDTPNCLKNLFVPQQTEDKTQSFVEEIFFYGAGCTKEKSGIVSTALHKVFSQTTTIEVNSDMLGAAHALCGNQPGIICILGTGSNSCYYDGQQIVSNIPPLGYILGDEGSGAALGKRLVGDCLKKLLPEEICERFLARYQLTQPEIIEKVYRQSMPNRFLAGLSRFLYENLHEECLRKLLIECFSDFIRRNLLQYPVANLFFTGSIAYYYANELKEAAALYQRPVANITQRPMEGLIAYHTKK